MLGFIFIESLSGFRYFTGDLNARFITSGFINNAIIFADATFLFFKIRNSLLHFGDAFFRRALSWMAERFIGNDSGFNPFFLFELLQFWHKQLVLEFSHKPDAISRQPFVENKFSAP